MDGTGCPCLQCQNDRPSLLFLDGDDIFGVHFSLEEGFTGVTALSFLCVGELSLLESDEM